MIRKRAAVVLALDVETHHVVELVEPGLGIEIGQPGQRMGLAQARSQPFSSTRWRIDLTTEGSELS